MPALRFALLFALVLALNACVQTTPAPPVVVPPSSPTPSPTPPAPPPPTPPAAPAPPAPPPTITLELSASALVLSAGGIGQPVLATTNATGVSWALSSPLGNLSTPTGTNVTYTPPATLAARDTVTLTATANGTSKSVQLTVLPALGAVLAPSSASAFASPPDVANCNPGTLAQSAKDEVLLALNAIRALHGLASVTYNATHDAASQQASMLFASNKQLSHNPPSTWTCYTSTGATAAGNSNISLGYWTGGIPTPKPKPLGMVGGFLDEMFSPSRGHRRWLLSPFLRSVAVGWSEYTPTANDYRYGGNIWVINDGDATTTAQTSPDFVAYPYGDYPKDAFDPNAYLSFTALVDGSNAWRNAQSAVDYTNAQIQMTPSLAISNQASDYSGYGVPNFLEWKAAGLQLGQTYTVNINNVRLLVGGVWRNKNFIYSFRAAN